MSEIYTADQVRDMLTKLGDHQRRQNKYAAQKTEVGRITFDSKAEANRYSELKLLEAAWEIADLVLQPEYPIIINGITVCVYRADFLYRVVDTECVVVEDVKGMRTPVYKLKKRLVEAQYGFKIVEVRS